MTNHILIKGNKYGLVIHIEEDADIEEVRQEIVAKLTECEKFYKGSSLAISFEGRELSDADKREIIIDITEKCNINITCIMENNTKTEDMFRQLVEKTEHESDTSAGQFYKGTLRSGQVLESESSVIILGDVNPGAKVMASGNVIVLGSLRGNVYAGVSGNDKSFVVALDMNPVQIRIGNVIGRSSDGKGKKSDGITKIAYVDNGNIYIEPLNKEVLNEVDF